MERGWKGHKRSWMDRSGINTAAMQEILIKLNLKIYVVLKEDMGVNGNTSQICSVGIGLLFGLPHLSL